MWEKNIYSSVCDDGKKVPDLEERFALYENNWSIVLNEIIYKIRNNETLEISSNDKSQIVNFFYYQFKRIPERFRKLIGYGKFREQYRNYAIIKSKDDPSILV